MLSTAECLFFVLDHSTPLGGGGGGGGGGGTANTNGAGDASAVAGSGHHPGTGAGAECKDLVPGAPSSITPLAPILAAMFLDIVLSYSTNTSEDFQNIQWTFWELAKVTLPMSICDTAASLFFTSSCLVFAPK